MLLYSYTELFLIFRLFYKVSYLRFSISLYTIYI
nr:MAG TPA: hypothetical protein [Herelleviridae sp.]